MTDHGKAGWMRGLAAAGLLLLVIAFTCALPMGSYSNPRAALAAHVIGITGGLLLIAVGLLLPLVALSRRVLAVALWSLLASVYLGFVTQLAGAAFDLQRMFVVTAAGRPEGDPSLERLVEIVVKGITPLTIAPCLLLLWGLARRREPGR